MLYQTFFALKRSKESTPKVLGSSCVEHLYTVTFTFGSFSRFRFIPRDRPFAIPARENFAVPISRFCIRRNHRNDVFTSGGALPSRDRAGALVLYAINSRMTSGASTKGNNELSRDRASTRKFVSRDRSKCCFDLRQIQRRSEMRMRVDVT